MKKINKQEVILPITKELEFQEKVKTFYAHKEKSIFSFLSLFHLIVEVEDEPKGQFLARVDIPFLRKYINITIQFINRLVFQGYIEL